MTGRVKRRYDNSRRQAQVRATKAQAVDAAGRLFIDRGYVMTSIEAIGAAADTPVATIYRLFGSKVAILTAVLEVSFVSDDEPVALHDRPLARAAAPESDPRRRLEGYARVSRDVLQRAGPMQQVLRAAAGVDPDAAALLAEINRQRLDGQSKIARARSPTRRRSPTV